MVRTDTVRIDFLYRVIFTCVRRQVFKLVEQGSTFSFTRDLLYIASISYTRVLSDSGNPPVIRFCAFWVSYLRLVSLPDSPPAPKCCITIVGCNTQELEFKVV